MQIRKRAFFTGVFCVLLLAAVTSCRRDSSNRSMDELETLFRNIPDTVQTSVYWYWMSDNISKEGVVRDLRAMKEAGINRAFIGNIGYHSTPYGKVKIFSDEWWDILHTALKTATELNIQIGIFNSPGWSQSGGPWVKPAQAMRYLSASETIAEGGKTISLKLQKPHPDFQDVNVLAFPYQEDHTAKATLRSEPAAGELAVLTDGDTTKSVTAPAGEKWTLDLDFPQAVTARSVSVYPAHHGVRARVEIQAAEGSLFHPVKSFVFDRSNDALNVGFDRHAPVVIALPAVQAKRFRLVFSEMTPQFGLTEVFVSPLKKMERYTEKSLAKMFPTPFPMWDAYLWPDQPDAHDGGLAVQPARVIDISRYMDSSGTLKWTAPAGKWVILRNGMAPTGVVNDPASPEATGLEVDKMNADHLAPHFDAFLGEIMRRVPAEDRKTWKVVVQDSYEKGGQNWTDGFIEKFKKEYGYDPKPFIPVLRGYVVGNADMSDRFLWDLRRFVADRVAYDYVGGLRKISHENGLTTWLENYGHWGFPGEFLQYGGQSDEIGGEFWSEGDLGNIENRAASSSAHIYGKIKVSAESFTAGGNAYARYPALMKQRGDRFFTEGINNTLLHVYIEQPYEDKWPGVNADFSSEFNRHNTWFPFMPMFTQYLKRCNLMLQQGHYVADVAYFIGEDVPKMTGTRDPEIPQGYSYDYINAEALQTRIKVKDGRMNLPDGIAYKILVLPKLKTMRPELLKRLSQMVRQGAVVLGPKPERSPSLAGGGKADAEVRRMAAELWGNVDGQKVKFRQVGKGMIMSGLSLDEALEKQHIAPDCRIVPQDSALFIHRKLAGGDMYFISNQRGTQIDITPQFRLSGKAPELWDPLSGTIRPLPEYAVQDSATTVPLRLQAYQSAFIIFRDDKKPGVKKAVRNFPDPVKQDVLEGAWQVSFQSDSIRRGPQKPVSFAALSDWTKNPDPQIRYYSGTAVYRKTFKADPATPGAHILLDLGRLTAMARVKVNGNEAGGAWTAPWQVDITKWVKPGDNTLEVEVVNNWMNRLIGDLNLPENERKTWTNVFPYNTASPLQPSGLLGPVSLQTIRYK